MRRRGSRRAKPAVAAAKLPGNKKDEGDVVDAEFEEVKDKKG